MKEVVAYLHTHWDREWYRTFEEFRLRLIEVFDLVLEYLEKGIIPCFYFDGQTAALLDYLEIRPEKSVIIKSLIKQKKLFIGPFYCSSDSFLVSGECLYRNLQIGIDISKEFGENDFIAYIADSFGHSKDLPVLLKSLKLYKSCLWRGLGNLPADLCWNSIRVTNLIQGYFQDYLHSNLSVNQKAVNLKKYLDKISEKSGDILLLPIGGDHLSVIKNISETINKLNNIYEDYKLILASPFDYFNKTIKRKNAEGEFLDNTKTFILKGVYSTRPYIKRKNADIQWLLTRIAEPFNAVCSTYLNAKNRQNEINYAYKLLVKNHAHDSIYGCCLDEVSDEIMLRYQNVSSIANDVIKYTIHDIEDNDGNLAVINLSGYKYSGKIVFESEKELNLAKISTRKGFTDKKIYNINDIPITEDITNIHTYLMDVKDLEPFSLTNITDKYICHDNFLKIKENSIENENIKVEIQDNKIIVTDKIKKETYKDFITIQDRADIGDSYNFGPLDNDKAVNGIIKSFKTKKNIKAVLNVIYEIKIPVTSTIKKRASKFYKCKINLDFILYNQSKMVEVKVYWINKSKNHILQIGFNLKDKITSTVSEDLFSHAERIFVPEYDIYKKIPAPKGIELKTNTAPMQRFVNTQNLTLITKGINEYEVNKKTLYLTLLRATGMISNPKNPSRGTPAGPPFKTPKMQCLGENISNFAFAFTDNIDLIYKLTEEFYNPCICLFTKNKDRVFIKPQGRVYSIFTENSKLVSRIFDGELKNIVISDTKDLKA